MPAPAASPPRSPTPASRPPPTPAARAPAAPSALRSSDQPERVTTAGRKKRVPPGPRCAPPWNGASSRANAGACSTESASAPTGSPRCCTRYSSSNGRRRLSQRRR
ncbi:hypothetical protein DMB38_14880 [Streptomyces sp. WAC 06738]|nr:hypothetical protein DMB38_14880 [Streptomyces sp. WAC 06738]